MSRLLRTFLLALGLCSTGVHGQIAEKNIQFATLASLSLSKDQPIRKAPPGLADQMTESIQVEYANGADSDGAKYLQLRILNRSKRDVGHYGLFLGGVLQVMPGQVYRMKASLAVDRGRSQGGIGVGYHIMGAKGEYLTELATPYSRGDVYHRDRQEVSADYVGGTLLERVGAVPTAIWPRLTVSNVLPGAALTVKLYGMTMARGELKGVGILPLPVKQALPKDGVLKLSVNLLARSLMGEYVSTLRLIDAAGKTRYQASHSGSSHFSGTSGSLIDAWQFRLPDLKITESEEVFKIAYELKPSASKNSAKLLPLSNDVLEQESAEGYQYLIGSVSVGARGGAWIGASFHHYPASTLGDSLSAIGPVKLKYKFARSLANDHANPPWWSLKGGKIVYNWEAFERWALLFSKAGDKSLLVVFSGMPASASSAPENRDNAFRAPGWSMPPKDLDVFERVVFDTVTRYKDRIFGVECWNEPDVPGFFGGSSTDLADMCKSLYQGVKRVDSRIPVLCPQTPSPEGMGYVLSARTSSGTPMTDYCDMVGAHIYLGLGRDLAGKAYAAESLSEQVATIRQQMASHGVSKPIAVTEFGIDRCATRAPAGKGHLERLTDAEKADVVYQSIATLIEEGVKVLALYSYDLARVDTDCFKGGYLWTTNPSVTSINEPVVRRINEAVTDFGAKKASW